MGAQVLDHGRVVPGSLVAQLALEWLLTWGGAGGGEWTVVLITALKWMRDVC